MGSVWFEDDGFLDNLTGLLLTDRVFAKQFAPMLDADDFRARTEALHGNDRWIIVAKTLEHWQRYREPPGKLIIPDLKQYAKVSRLGPEKLKKLVKLAKGYLHTDASAVPVGDKVVEFKQQVLKATALDEILELQTAGMLTDEKWMELTRKALLTPPDSSTTVNYFDTLNDRSLRRLSGNSARYPHLMIEPFDSMVRAIARGDLGLVMAPWKGRKSLMLLWIALAYAFQGLKVVYYTLEDPLEEVEDRLDAMVTRVRIKDLTRKYRLVAARFPRFKRWVSSNLIIKDYTAQPLSIAQVGADLDLLREEKFIADAVVIDYDDEIQPVKKNQERRFEFAEIYRSYRHLCAKRGIYGWTGAQTNKESEGKKIITGRDLAEDVSKARKVTLAIGIGAGDWGPASNYLHVAAHKRDHMHRGCHIMGDPERMVFYDHDATQQAMKKYAKK